MKTKSKPLDAKAKKPTKKQSARDLKLKQPEQIKGGLGETSGPRIPLPGGPGPIGNIRIGTIQIGY
jgi:hypothetical protein